jgi:transposase
MYRNGLEAKVIGQYTGISYNTIINWVKQSRRQRPAAIEANGKSETAAEDDYPNFITSLEHPHPAFPALSS